MPRGVDGSCRAPQRPLTTVASQFF